MGVSKTSVSIVWIIFGCFVAYQASQLTVWTELGPDSGFVPLVAAGIVVLVSLAKLVPANRDEEQAYSFAPKADAVVRLLSVLAALVGMALLVEPLGFLLAAVLTMIVLLRVIQAQSWIKIVALAISSSVLTYWLFTSFDVLLPRGSWGF